MPRHPFAFVVHPRADVRKDLRRVWKPLGRLPRRALDRAMRLPVPALPMGDVTFTDAPGTTAGRVLMVPIGAALMLSADRAFVLRQIGRALDAAARRGARTVGLGALTAPVSGGGRRVAGRPDVGVTNGNAYTAVMTVQGIERLLPRCPTTDPHVAVVGATGSVGSCVTRLLAGRGVVSRMTLVARTPATLDRLAAEVGRPGLDVAVSTSLSSAREADLVVLMTSAPDAILGSEHLKPGAVVLDDTQPRNTRPSLATDRPDVTVVDGGVVAVPGADIRADIGLPPRTTYACMAETMLLALDGHEGDFSVGRPTVEHADHIEALAGSYGHLGFHLAPPHSFGRPLGAGWEAAPADVAVRPAPVPLAA